MLPIASCRTHSRSGLPRPSSRGHSRILGNSPSGKKAVERMRISGLLGRRQIPIGQPIPRAFPSSRRRRADLLKDPVAHAIKHSLRRFASVHHSAGDNLRDCRRLVTAHPCDQPLSPFIHFHATPFWECLAIGLRSLWFVWCVVCSALRTDSRIRKQTLFVLHFLTLRSISL